MQKIKVAVLNTWSSNQYIGSIAVVRITDNLIITISKLQNIIQQNEKEVRSITASRQYSNGTIPCYFISTDAAFNEIGNDYEKRIPALCELMQSWFEDDDDRIVIAEMDSRYLPVLEAASMVSNEPDLNVYLGGIQFSETDDNGDLYETKDLGNLDLIKSIEIEVKW